MNRRDILMIGSATIAAATTANILACAETATDKLAGGKAAPDKAAGGKAVAPPVAADPHAGHGAGENAAIAMAAVHCEIAGDSCIAHCIELMAGGDTSMASCARAVRDMLATSGMMSALVSAKSKHLAAAVALWAATCRDCKTECDKHADKHETCKACADACDAALAAAAKFV